MFWQSILPASLLVARAHAGLEGVAVDDLLARDSGVLERRMEYFPGQDGVQAAHIIKRQSPGVALNGDGTINMTAWDETANKACHEALSKLPESSNPSGTCVCYNLPALNNVTGAFEADLRLYQLTAPSGEFAGIPQQNIQVGLQYHGASVSPITPSAAAGMRIAARQDPGTGAPKNLRILQTYLFVGQIDKDKMKPGMDMATLEALVMPTVTLSAVNPTGQTVSTNVSSNEAAFVAGVFSDSIVMSEFSAANMAVDESLRQLANSTVPFVLPGVQIMIFPIGLIITSVWLVGFVGAVGFGTIERMGFREQYRRRIAMQGKGGMARI